MFFSASFPTIALHQHKVVQAHWPMLHVVAAPLSIHWAPRSLPCTFGFSDPDQNRLENMLEENLHPFLEYCAFPGAMLVVSKLDKDVMKQNETHISAYQYQNAPRHSITTSPYHIWIIIILNHIIRLSAFGTLWRNQSQAERLHPIGARFKGHYLKAMSSSQGCKPTQVHTLGDDIWWNSWNSNPNRKVDQIDDTKCLPTCIYTKCLIEYISTGEGCHQGSASNVNMCHMCRGHPRR